MDITDKTWKAGAKYYQWLHHSVHRQSQRERERAEAAEKRVAELEAIQEKLLSKLDISLNK